MRAAALSGVVLLAGCAHDVPELRGIGVPGAVRDFIVRREACNHWAGEEPYDDARRAEIAHAVERLRCATLDDEAAALKARWPDDPRVAETIDRSAAW